MRVAIKESEYLLCSIRGLFYKILANGFRKPSKEQLNYLKTEFIKELYDLCQLIKWQKNLKNNVNELCWIVKDLKFDNFLVEYNKLFEPYGGNLAPPYETEYTKETPQHSLSHGAEYADIAGFYKAFGLEVSTDSPERVDHIVTELEFMHFLICKELYTYENKEYNNQEIVIDAQKKFMKDHLSLWPANFSKRIKGTGVSQFFTYLSQVNSDWVYLDKSFLGSEI